MKVVEIFKSIDGEGIRAGFPVTFIRFVGCNLRCTYCDTKYSYDNPEYIDMTCEEILNKVLSMSLKRVTITGGEPLYQKDLFTLVELLVNNDIEVNIETNGSLDVSKYCGKDNIIVTMDYKCPCSGMEKQMYLPNLETLTEKDVLKFVVANEKDLNRCKSFYNKTKAQIFISPVFNEIEPREIVEYILKNNLDNARVQVQLHKIIWHPDMKGV